MSGSLETITYTKSLLQCVCVCVIHPHLLFNANVGYNTICKLLQKVCDTRALSIFHDWRIQRLTDTTRNRHLSSKQPLWTSCPPEVHSCLVLVSEGLLFYVVDGLSSSFSVWKKTICLSPCCEHLNITMATAATFCDIFFSSCG